jgi:uncharacterized protein (DUF2236 family)
MPREVAPPSYGAFRAYWRAKLAGDELYLTEEARYIGYATAFEIPMPRSQQLGKRVHDAIMLGSLPRRARELYGVPYPWKAQLAFAAAVQTARAARQLMPKVVARGWNTRSFEGVAREERTRIERGRPTPQMGPEGPVGIRLPARRAA